ncbi:MAG: polymerase protein [Microgenomates group bacterium GW2011_GWC1_38_12]|nr:MAG: polymerase protein [Microgenomates group bacterium GW2011_GWC1_38_12]
MSKLVLIDGNAILHRAYHALPPLTTRRGEPINAVYGLVSMLLRVIQDLKPTHIAVCFDRKEPTFRHETYKEYQAQRPVIDKELSGQFEKAKETISAMNIPIFEKAGFEADDLLGSIAEQAQRTKNKEQSRIDQVVIVTGDRDILQLVNEKVKVFLPVRGLSEGRLFGVEEVKEKMGVLPSQIPDYKALVGDQSDNYPGISGIGPKTAEKLLDKYKSFPEIYKHLDEINISTKTKLVEKKDDGEMSYRLAKIVTDVELENDIEQTNRWQIDSQQVLDLFYEFGFKTLAKRVKEVGKSIVSENQMKLI